MMNDIYLLQNQVKHYEWGSYDFIPDFLGIKNTKNLPYAELWMGTHSGAPSQVEINGNLVNLKDISGELPFLFKLLAVDKPLSIQAHPDKEQAEIGFSKEEELGISLKNPMRNYKDNNHKPEILCALTPITLMAGFKEPVLIQKSLEELLTVAPQIKEFISSLIHALKTKSLGGFFNTLFNTSGFEREYFNSFLLDKNSGVSDSVIQPQEKALIKQFISQYPGDPAVISPLYLNLITLLPGQAVYIPAGILHAYISGFGIELMTSSDNVLRGGLTPKHVDINELSNILYFVPFKPQIISPSSSDLFCFHAQKKDFSLCFIKNSGGLKKYILTSNTICIVTEGELQTCGKSFKKGQSFFIKKNTDEDHIIFDGNFSLYAASDSTIKKYENI